MGSPALFLNTVRRVLGVPAWEGSSAHEDAACIPKPALETALNRRFLQLGAGMPLGREGLQTAPAK